MLKFVLPELDLWLDRLKAPGAAWRLMNHRVTFYVETEAIRMEHYDLKRSRWRSVLVKRFALAPEPSKARRTRR
jgi:hypothetical protein